MGLLSDLLSSRGGVENFRKVVFFFLLLPETIAAADKAQSFLSRLSVTESLHGFYGGLGQNQTFGRFVRLSTTDAQSNGQ